MARPCRQRFPVRGLTPTIRHASAFDTPREINRVNSSRFAVCGTGPGRPRTIATPEHLGCCDDRQKPPRHPGARSGCHGHERAVSPVDGSELWVVLDADLIRHREASEFLRCLVGADRSPHTVRAYVGRAAMFLGWCAAQGVDW